MNWLDEKHVAVIDNGTGYTKLGYSGNLSPQHIVPTAIAAADDGFGDLPRAGNSVLTDLDFYSGVEALNNQKHYAVNYPIRHGLVDNWNNMERLWQRCYYDYLRCDPSEHFVLLTEPPMNPPENREYTAEVMFETFGVPGMYIGVQAILALAASWASNAMAGKGRPEDSSLTGVVVDSGDGVTHVIPVAEGYVIGSAIKHIPLAGRDITAFIQKQLRDRGEAVLPEDSLELAKQIKEQHCYVGQDLLKEYRKWDSEPSKYFKKILYRPSRSSRAGLSSGSMTPVLTAAAGGGASEIDVSYERFLAPELFFNPEIYSSDWSTPLPQVVDEAILACPIDTRRGLYRNIVLSGGSTMFKHFDRRLQQDLKERVDARLASNMAKLRVQPERAPEPMKVRVHSHEIRDMQKYAVWYGGSMLASTPEFYRVCHTKAQYQEEGSRIARHNAVFNIGM